MNVVDFSKCLRADSLTHPGLVRQINEDALGFFLEDGCFFVADGMGGGAAGDVASSLLENEISDAIEQTFGEPSDQRKMKVQKAIHDAHQKIRSCAESRSYKQMGTTLALMLFDPRDVRFSWLCHIGDSRIYRLRGHLLSALTTDHTLGVELGRMEKREWNARKLRDHQVSRYSHVLTRVVGGQEEPAPEWQETDILPLDRFLICSDGITTMLSEDAIKRILSISEQPSDAVLALGNSVLNAGAKDNFSMIVIDIGDGLSEPIHGAVSQ